jgi:hypothetical protein
MAKFELGSLIEPSKNADDSRIIAFVLARTDNYRPKEVLNMKNWDLVYIKNKPRFGYLDTIPDPSASGSHVNHSIGESISFELRGDVLHKELVTYAHFDDASVNWRAELSFQYLLYGKYRTSLSEFFETGEGTWGTGDEAMGKQVAKYYLAGQTLLRWHVLHIPYQLFEVRQLRNYGRDSAQFKYARKHFSKWMSDSEIEARTNNDIIIMFAGLELGISSRDPRKIMELIMKEEGKDFEREIQEFRRTREKDIPQKNQNNRDRSQIHRR